MRCIFNPFPITGCVDRTWLDDIYNMDVCKINEFISSLILWTKMRWKPGKKWEQIYAGIFLNEIRLLFRIWPYLWVIKLQIMIIYFNKIAWNINTIINGWSLFVCRFMIMTWLQNQSMKEKLEMVFHPSKPLFNNCVDAQQRLSPTPMQCSGSVAIRYALVYFNNHMRMIFMEFRGPIMTC